MTQMKYAELAQQHPEHQEIEICDTQVTALQLEGWLVWHGARSKKKYYITQ